MKLLWFLIAWGFLLVLCWPLAILLILLWPFVWVLALPFRLMSIVCHALLALVSALLFLPARLLGYRPRSSNRA